MAKTKALNKMWQSDYWLSINCMKLMLWTIMFLSINLNGSSRAEAINFDHSIDLNDDYRVLWNIVGQEITFEIQVRTLGYVGFGFSRDGRLPGSDIAIGWVSQGKVHFQDRHVKSKGGDMEPVVDPSQDYVLMLGYENATHTVMRFKRKLDTCDTSYDIAISNDTMRIIYMYDENDPRHGSVVPGNLPNPQEAYKGYRPLFLTQKSHQRESMAIDTDPNVKILELRNEDVELPQADDTLYWCKMFKLQDIYQKIHMVKFEPVFDSASSMPYLQHIILYECSGSSSTLELMSREQGRQCYRPNNPSMACNAIVATWAKGSEGFVFPPETGYPLDPNQARFYQMETHYNNPRPTEGYNSNIRQKADSSGLKIYYTEKLRKFDAGVLSIGMDPNWRHIIPPFQHRVISEGHCVEDCTRRAFPRQGINVFAAMMRTHMIGKEVRLRHVRNNVEYAPIAMDRNFDPNYQEFRRLPTSVRVLPGDRLISECTYDSSFRDQITLGGLTTREESCTVLTYYYPRQKRLTTCHSLPSLPTVLHSLGIEELAIGSNPVLIALPPELAGMSLESRLISYDWKKNFNSFQQVTRNGSFKAICWDAKNVVIPHTDNIEGTNPNVTKPWQPPASSCTIKSNSKSFEDAFNGGENSRHRQNSSYKPAISNKNSNSPSIRNRNNGGGGGGGNGGDNNNNNNSNPRNYGYDGSLGERTEPNYMENNHLNDDSGSGAFDDLDDDNARIRNKVSRSSSAARESMGLNGSQASMFAMTIAQTFIVHSIAYLFTIRVIS